VGQLSTSDHLHDRGFWPTKPAMSADDYSGPDACLPCHRKEGSQPSSEMARNANSNPAAGVLKSHPDLTFSVGNIHYEIKTKDDISTYSVTDGTRTLVNKLLWAFGLPRAGQSYLFKKDDEKFYEARITYFTSIPGLGFTPARDLTNAPSLEDAMAREVSSHEVKRCFSCHTTASVVGDKLDEKDAIPGVTCEACHGPGAKHSANMYAGSIYNPAKLDPPDSVDFCGACHGALGDVTVSRITGPNTARFQPYRLETSKCWGLDGDARLTCVSCHNPHQPLETNLLAYDHVCTSCHQPAERARTKGAAATAADGKTPPHACSVATKKCVSCHMPKVWVPQMHNYWTDHRIRIARKDEAYPD
jgi:predicted CXXCH cytochrome family protein